MLMVDPVPDLPDPSSFGSTGIGVAIGMLVTLLLRGWQGLFSASRAETAALREETSQLRADALADRKAHRAELASIQEEWAKERREQRTEYDGLQSKLRACEERETAWGRERAELRGRIDALERIAGIPATGTGGG